MSEDSESSGPRFASLVPPPWTWVPIAGSASLLGASFALDPWTPWGSGLPRLLFAGGLGILAGASVYGAARSRTLSSSEPTVAGTRSRPAESPSTPHPGVVGGPGSSRSPGRAPSPNTRHAGALDSLLDRESDPGGYLWRSWVHPDTRLPGELVGPVAWTAYTPPRSGSPVLHEEGEPIFLGAPSGDFSRSGGFLVSTEGLGPMDPLPPMIPVALDEDDDYEGPHPARFAGPGSSSLRLEIHAQILDEAIAKLGRIPAELLLPPDRPAAPSPHPRVPRGSARPGSERHLSREHSRHSTPGAAGPGRVAVRPRRPRSVQLADILDQKPVPPPDDQGRTERAMTVGDLVARKFAEGGASRSGAVSPAAPRTVSRSVARGHSTRGGHRCADCHLTFTAVEGSRRCVACLRTICPDCATSAPRSNAGAWCARCASARETDSFSSEVDRRALPATAWAAIAEPDPDFGLLMG